MSLLESAAMEIQVAADGTVNTPHHPTIPIPPSHYRGFASKVETTMARNMAGKKPTAEDAAAARKTLGLPASPPAKKRRKPKAKAVKTRKR